MKHEKLRLRDAVFSGAVLAAAFGASLLVKHIFNSHNLIPMIFVMGVFQIALRTTGYFWGVSASLISVLAVNYAFTFPFYAIDLISPDNLFSALVMLIVAIMTGTLTTKIRVQEKIEAEIERERMRANLLRAVSHDLRTPLTSIYGASSTVMENYDTLTREQKIRLLNEVRDDAQWLIRMVENLLSVTRIDGGRAKIDKQPVVLEELIDSVLNKFAKHYPGIIPQVSMPEEFLVVPMDVMLIQQVLVNLLENAAIHAEGMTRLWLTVRREGNALSFTVRDNGCGVPEERIKTMFAGCTGSGDIPSDGTRHNMGIGLSLCAAIVNAHGEEIYARNDPEGGLAVTFCMGLEENHE